LITKIKSVFYGSADPASDPDLYLNTLI